MPGGGEERDGGRTRREEPAAPSLPPTPPREIQALSVSNPPSFGRRKTAWSDKPLLYLCSSKSCWVLSTGPGTFLLFS